MLLSTGTKSFRRLKILLHCESNGTDSWNGLWRTLWPGFTIMQQRVWVCRGSLLMASSLGVLCLRWAYGPTWSFLVWRLFCLHLSSHCLCRCCVRLGPSLGMVYSLGHWGVLRAELVIYRLGGNACLCSHREEWDWEVEQLMQLQGFKFWSPDCYKNSDLKSKWNTGTS